MDALIDEPFIAGLFLFAGFVFLVLEVFVPSGGILGILSLGCTGFGVFSLFHQGHTIIATLALVLSIGFFLTMVRLMIRRLKFPAALPPDTSNSVDRRIADLVSREGITVTALRPAGMAMIDGRKVDVVTLGEFIEKDVPIRVVDNSGNRVVVREIQSRSPTT
jgi:membrane-bound serine protease (ClpP class)